MNALVGAFDHERTLVGAFSKIVKLQEDLFPSSYNLQEPDGAIPVKCTNMLVSVSRSRAGEVWAVYQVSCSPDAQQTLSQPIMVLNTPNSADL